MNRRTLLNLKNGDDIGGFIITSPHKHPRDGVLATPVGKGGTGIVYLAKQVLYKNASVNRAIKFFIYRDDVAQEHKTSGPISSSHFEHEIVNLTSFNHDNIVKVIQAGEYHLPTSERVIPYIVSEFIEGQSFEDVIDDPALVTELFAANAIGVLDFATQLFQGLAYLHSKNFFHCDIAPKNLFLCNLKPNIRVVITDLGIGHTRSSNKFSDNKHVVVRGTRKYSPQNVAKLLGKSLSSYDFFQLQPSWDNYGAAKSIFELLDSLIPQLKKQTWVDALKSYMGRYCDDPRGVPSKTILSYLYWLRPENREFAQIPELSQYQQGMTSWQIPIKPVNVSSRIMAISNHNCMLRLKNVPQLLMASPTFPAAIHTRYEHSLGVYENMRQYLKALANHTEFLKHFIPEHMELALISALLSSVARHPFSLIIKECRQLNGNIFKSFSTESLLIELMEETYCSSNESLRTIINNHFPNVDTEKIIRILSKRGLHVSDISSRIVQSLLDSSIGVRVLDYLRRDSLYAGLNYAWQFDSNDLLKHIFFDVDRIGVKASGIAVVEEIVSMRNWLFNRLYWNRPSRSYQTMMRHMLVTLNEIDEDFESSLREVVLQKTENELFKFTQEYSKNLNVKRIVELIELIMKPRPSSFKQVYEINRSQEDARRIDLWEKISIMSMAQREQLRKSLDHWMIDKYGLNNDKVNILIDMPTLPYPIKLGEDINVRTYRGDQPIIQLSKVVAGIHSGLRDNLQRFRVFVHPKLVDLIGSDSEDVEMAIMERL